MYTDRLLNKLYTGRQADAYTQSRVLSIAKTKRLSEKNKWYNVPLAPVEGNVKDNLDW